MHAWYLYPSLWTYFPSALLHFLLVEVRCVLAAAVSWYFLCRSMAEMADLSNVEDEAKRQAMANQATWIVFCGYGIPAAMLLSYGIYSLTVHAGFPLSCGSGAYLGWTWRLEHDVTYKRLVIFMFFIPGMVLLGISYDVIELLTKPHKEGGHASDWQSKYRNHEVLVSAFVVPMVIMMIALVGLLCPQMPPNGWDPEQLDKVLFARSWGNFAQPNDMYGFKLVDALWKAEHGKNEELLEYLRDPSDQTIVMHVCREPQDAAKEA